MIARNGMLEPAGGEAPQGRGMMRTRRKETGPDNEQERLKMSSNESGEAEAVSQQHTTWPVDDRRTRRNEAVLSEYGEGLVEAFSHYIDPYMALPVTAFAKLQGEGKAIGIELPYACSGHHEAMRTLLTVSLPDGDVPILNFSQAIEALPVADRSPKGGPQTGHAPLIQPRDASKPSTAASSGQSAALPGVRNIIAVASGKGGVGKSTSSVNLALALQAEGARVGIVDADIYGPSMGMMCGVAEGTRPEIIDFDGTRFFQPIDVFADAGAAPIQLMSMAFLVNDKTPMVWRGPMVSGALLQLITQTHWQGLDYLIVDLPPGTGDIQLTLSQKVPLSAAVIVTTPQDIALLDARKAVSMFEKVDVPVLGVIENMSVHICSNCGHREHLFGSEGGARMAEEYGLPLLGQIPLHLTIREQTDRGRPTVYAEPESEVGLIYRDMARNVSARLAIRCAHAKNAAPGLIAHD
ncbi:iron-sulfur cluster carrier protein ApbC [Allohahella sp. A8]|uniref:iron-sulfur cluster carrier protein ApbC n=1 Tax=Allohahella sp. A8 TaxID=3141461 RepID=UPI003A812781